MQNRYSADIGDYIKLSLLRSISVGRLLGIAWYLYPDESHNSDGKHIRYLSDPGKWRWLDPNLFDALAKIASGVRSVEAIEKSGVLQVKAICKDTLVSNMPAKDRSSARASWFSRNLKALAHCDLVFADPDNGIIDDSEYRRSQQAFGKQMPISEVLALAEGRSAVIYHHNTRFKGGHDAEVDYWISRLGSRTIAVRANAFSCRTFFIINPDEETKYRTTEFCRKWADHKVRLHCL